ncbi:hypothetical protein EGR_07378 [Echinococcus granulosus]|uniref:Uncharacterized protein n=1 Tax=Echinococcus granulosus TaxID=6210 RepID=W6U8S6_ECHGR|nr:hypothetical protein EGR_07378 [Echinococcus granulosus]EUB57718.1 hypothetical protein EGR_07378 [Echinococcus granulosus]
MSFQKKNKTKKTCIVFSKKEQLNLGKLLSKASAHFLVIQLHTYPKSPKSLYCGTNRFVNSYIDSKMKSDHHNHLLQLAVLLLKNDSKKLECIMRTNYKYLNIENVAISCLFISRIRAQSW